MKSLRINLENEYDIIISAGIISEAGRIVSEKCEGFDKIAVITDDNVDKLYSDSLLSSFRKCNTYKYVIPHGEQSKNFAELEKILMFLADNGFTRNDVVAALGGGVVGDIAGLASALYMRGIRLVQIPTTLLAMTDSSVGGKTAVDLPQGKNLIGAFHQPSLVLCDTDCLKTLDKKTFSEGIAEIIKYGIISDKNIVERLLKNDISDDIEYYISRSLEIKAGFAERDEFDNGERQALNFGHTVAHAIEKCSDYTIPHGLAVATGMLIEARGLEKSGYITENVSNVIERLLEKYNLPFSVSYSAGELFKAARKDKKSTSDNITLVIPERLGAYKLKKISLEVLSDIIKDGIER